MTTINLNALGQNGIMERVVRRENLLAAMRRVRRNNGSPGIDGMTVSELGGHLVKNWKDLRRQLLDGSYQPQPVRLCEIPKRKGGTRTLGIPTVRDRLIQQALLQVLQTIFDPTFSDHSHGFRPKRGTHGALKEAREHITAGKTWVVDIDLEKFFDRVNHDILMSRVARKIEDRRVLKLIRRYLNAGLMSSGVLVQREHGTPQGGPLSPLLANILLDEVDKGLEQRGHAFVRYADDVRVFVQSERAGLRVMAKLRKTFAELKLQINEDKSAVAPVGERPFLGYSLYLRKENNSAGLGPAAESLRRIRAKIKIMTRRNSGRNLKSVIAELAPRIRGWREYLKLSTNTDGLRRIQGWMRRRLRAMLLRQWKTCHNARKKLHYLGVSERIIRGILSVFGRWWRAAGSASHIALPKRFFEQLGLPQLFY